MYGITIFYIYKQGGIFVKISESMHVLSEEKKDYVHSNYHMCEPNLS
jgi:hypothetical protein